MHESESEQDRRDTAAHQQTTEQHGQTTGQPHGVLGDAVEGASGGVVTVITGTEAILKEVVHAAGRLGEATVSEVFNLLGTVVGGVSDTASALFQGRRMPTRTRTEQAPERQRQTSP